MKINEIMDPKKSTYFLNNALQSEIGEVKMFRFFVPVNWKQEKNHTNQTKPKKTTPQICVYLILYLIASVLDIK